MRVRFYIAGDKQRELDIAEVVGHGIRACGDVFETAAAAAFVEPSDAEIACVFALKGRAREILDAYRLAGARTLLFDKGLIRASTGMGAPMGYFRVALDEFMPLARMTGRRWPSSRWLATGMAPLPQQQKTEGGRIIYAGSSQKYCDFHGLGDATEYASDIIRQIGKHLPKPRKRDWPIVYRPKPSWADAVPIAGTIFSRPPEALGSLLRGAHALVTHGSHAAIDAILAGVPAVVLGPGAARPVASTSLEDIAAGLRFPAHAERLAWLSALAWWQWRVEEMQDGSMWRFLRAEMERPS